jgi:hypothetical protein
MIAPAIDVTFARPPDLRAAVRAASPTVRFLVVPGARYFTVEGTSAPGEQEFRDAIGSLYPVAYTLHFLLKRRGVTAPIGALEGDYAAADPGTDLTGVLTGARPMVGGWHWRLRLPIPDAATSADIAAAIDDVRRKESAPLIDAVRVQTVGSAEAAQVLHLGPYDAEAATVRRLLEAIAAAGLEPRGGHHEIYVSDPNRVPPDRIKTVIRMHVAAAGTGTAAPQVSGPDDGGHQARAEEHDGPTPSGRPASWS